MIAHDIPLEIGEFGVQLRSGFTKRQIIIRNLLASTTLLIGSVFAYQIGSEVNIPMEYVYGGVAGFFIYLALSDIIPTIHASEKARYGLQTGFLFFGLLFGATVASFAHSYIDVGHAGHDHGGHDDHDDHDKDKHEEHEDHDEHDEHDDHDKDKLLSGLAFLSVGTLTPDRIHVLHDRVTFYHGKRDRIAPLRDISRLARSCHCSLKTFDGGHFFFRIF